MFDALDEFYASKEDSAYYTCFVDENFYERHPDPRITVPVHLKDFINCKDRIFSLATDLEFSQDGKSAVSQSVYTLKQRSIACFYDMNDETLNKFGLESVEEQKHILYEPEPGERKFGTAERILGKSWMVRLEIVIYMVWNGGLKHHLSYPVLY